MLEPIPFAGYMEIEEMNNEPVAYAMFRDGEFYDAIHPKQYTEHIGSYTIPLYTHPSEHDLGIAEAIGFDKGYAVAQAKTLTDEEIGELIGQYSHYENWEGFARAILKKASEK